MDNKGQEATRLDAIQQDAMQRYVTQCDVMRRNETRGNDDMRGNDEMRHDDEKRGNKWDEMR